MRLLSFLIEAQDIFVPALSETLIAADFDVTEVTPQPDMHALLQAKPDAVFIDLDFVDRDPLEAVNIIRKLLPETLLCVSTSDPQSGWWRSCRAAGANAVFSKASTRDEIIAGLKYAASNGSFIDDRLDERARSR